MKFSTPTILLVEDDRQIREAVAMQFCALGYKVIPAENSTQAESAIACTPFDVAFLDVLLPDGNGFDLLKKIRKSRPGTVIIMLTALGGENDCVRGLRDGADDYVTKPFRIRELSARVEAALRRSRKSETVCNGDEKLQLRNAYVDFRRRIIVFDNGEESVELTEKESALLHYFSISRERVVSIEELMTSIWKIDPRVEDSCCVSSAITRLRKKLKNACAIVALYRQGYRFEI